MMAEVKWIKIVTDIFDDEKMQLIESMPESDSIIVIWFKLLCTAGKQNNNGVFMLNDKIPYTDEMLATIFRRPLNIVRLALNTFQSFDMIEIIDNVVTIPNWDKHQNIDGLEKIREQNRIRVAAHRQKQKQIAGKCNVTSNVTVTECNAIDIDIDKEVDKDKNKDKESKKKYGTFDNVLLTQNEYDKLLNDYPNSLEAINFLSDYIKLKGYKAKSHYLAIKKWVFKAIEEQAIKDAELEQRKARLNGTPNNNKKVSGNEYADLV